MFLIYISGIDGCGKTTQATLLVDLLKEKGVDAQYAWLRWEPSLRKVFSFLKSASKKTEKNTILSRDELERIQHNEWVSLKTKILSFNIIRQLWWIYACADYYFTSRKPFRKLNSEVLVIDRYFLDFLIDQASNLGVKPADTQKLLNNFFLKRFKHPDLTVIIDLPAAEGYKRKLDGTPLNYLKEREKRYHWISSPEDTLHVNGLNDIDVVADKISQWVLSKLWSSIA
jgi:thymidylate kinase